MHCFSGNNQPSFFTISFHLLWIFVLFYQYQCRFLISQNKLFLMLKLCTSFKKFFVVFDKQKNTHLIQSQFYLSQGWVEFDLRLFTTHFSDEVLLKYGSEEKGSSLCRCSILLGFIMSKKLRGLWFYLLIKVQNATSLVFLTY